jgi:hypothetical protein
MALEQFKSLATTTLNGGINNSTTTVVVTTGSVFPSIGNFRILIDSEIMLCTARSSNTLTVTRAQEGTSAASHSDLATVTLPLTADSIIQSQTDLSPSIGALASVPSAAKNGLIYLANDSQMFTRDNGSSLSYMYGLRKLTQPVLSDFTWLNQGSCTTDTTKGGIAVTIPKDTTSAVNLRVLHKSKTPPYTVTGLFVLNQQAVSYHSCGMGFYDPTGGRLVSMHFIVFTSDYSYVEVCNWANTTTFSSAPTNMLMARSGNRMGWMQVQHDSTNIIFRMSNDGYNWITVYTAGKTAYMANDPTKVMFYGRNSSTNVADHQFKLLSWEEA